MMLDDCARAEITAGALALGEASEVQRDEYRRHIAGCRGCVTGLGGERDIEATMRVIAQARDGERWEPNPPSARRHRTGPARMWQAGAFGIAAACALWIGGRAFATHPSAIVQRVADARNAPAVAPPTAVRPPARGHDLVVLHNVATLKRPPLLAVKQPSRAAQPVTPRARAAAPAPRVKVPVQTSAVAQAASAAAAAAPSQRDERSVLALRTVGSAAPAPGRAESLAVLPPPGVTRDAIPLGGEEAIVPHPPAIAYYENAEGTTAFEVSVDERGVPTKCIVTKSSGFVVLDEAVCQAAMRARYSPRTINGRAVAGIYRDALTFQAGDDR